MKKIIAFPYRKWMMGLTAYYSTFAFLFGLRLYFLLPAPTDSTIELILLLMLPVVVWSQKWWFRKMLDTALLLDIGRRAIYVSIGVLPLALLLIPLSNVTLETWGYGMYLFAALFTVIRISSSPEP